MKLLNNNKICQKGFTLIELMLSLLIGLFLIAGVFTVYINSSKSQRSVEVEVKMLDDARFALDVIGYDLRHAGMWGQFKESAKAEGSNILVAGECRASWAVDASSPVFGFNDPLPNPYSGVCLNDFYAGDLFETRYVMSSPVVAIDPSILYLYANYSKGTFMLGGGPVVNDGGNGNYPVVAHAYYLKSWTDEKGDGIPSLHQITLQPGPSVTDIMLLSGVEDLQIQFGIDTTNDGAVNRYVNPSPGINWKKVISAQVWLVMRSANKYPNIDTSVSFNQQPFSSTGGTVAYGNDGYRRVMVNTVVQLRNSE